MLGMSGSSCPVVVDVSLRILSPRAPVTAQGPHVPQIGSIPSSRVTPGIPFPSGILIPGEEPSPEEPGAHGKAPERAPCVPSSVLGGDTWGRPSRVSHRIPEAPTLLETPPGANEAQEYPQPHSTLVEWPPEPGASHGQFHLPNAGNDPWVFYTSLEMVGMWKHSRFYPKDAELVIPTPNHLWMFYICLETVGILQVCQNSL